METKEPRSSSGNIFLGIDPGSSGALAVVGDEGVVKHYKLADKTERDVWDEFASYREMGGMYMAIIEHVHSMPRQGVSSSFKFGQSYGMLRGMLIASGIPFESVSPNTWQTYMKCKSGGDKNVTKRRAQELFPGVKMTHAIADALLIAEYARRTLAPW